MNKSPSYQQLTAVFEGLPVTDIITEAKKIQQQLIKNPSLIEYKDDNEVVTKADISIERIILDYFSASSLQKTYVVKSEEQAPQINNEASWQLIVDPLDGSVEFAGGGLSWGVMIGAADNTGELIFSWNLISTGKIFTSEMPVKLLLTPFADKIADNKKLIIDVFDYKADAAKNFKTELQKKYGLRPAQYQITSEPSAICAGFNIWRGVSDGLLWLPSTKGKQSYPDYDLIFLGALAKAGYAIRLGKLNNIINLVAVAPTDDDVEKLYDLGRNCIPKNIKLQKTNKLIITSSI